MACGCSLGGFDEAIVEISRTSCLKEAPQELSTEIETDRKSRIKTRGNPSGTMLESL